MVNTLGALAGTVIALAYLAGTRRPVVYALLLCLFECLVSLAILCWNLE